MGLPQRPFQSLAELHESELENFRCSEHREVRVFGAMSYCIRHDLEVPRGLLQEAVKFSRDTLLRQQLCKRGRSASPRAQYLQKLVHHARWDTVVEIRERQKHLSAEVKKLRAIKNRPQGYLFEFKKNRDQLGKSFEHAFVCASAMLLGTPAHAGPDAIKKSYLFVEKGLKDGTYRPPVLDPNLLRLFGIEWPSTKIRVRKSNIV